MILPTSQHSLLRPQQRRGNAKRLAPIVLPWYIENMQEQRRKKPSEWVIAVYLLGALIAGVFVLSAMVSLLVRFSGHESRVPTGWIVDENDRASLLVQFSGHEGEDVWTTARVERQWHVPCGSLQIDRCEDGDDYAHIWLKEAPSGQFYSDLKAAGWQQFHGRDTMFNLVKDRQEWKLFYYEKDHMLSVYLSGRVVGPDRMEKLHVPLRMLPGALCIESRSSGDGNYGFFHIQLNTEPGEDFFEALQAAGWQHKGEHIYERIEGGKLLMLSYVDWEHEIFIGPIGRVVSAQDVEKDLHIPCEKLQVELCLRHGERDDTENLILRLKTAPTEDFYRALEAAGWRRLGKDALFVYGSGNKMVVLLSDKQNTELFVVGKLHEINEEQVEEKYNVPTSSLDVSISCECPQKALLLLCLTKKPTERFERDLLDAGWKKQGESYTYTAPETDSKYLLDFDERNGILYVHPSHQSADDDEEDGAEER